MIGLPGETVEVKDNQVVVVSGDKKLVLNESQYLSKYSLTLGDVSLTLAPDEYFVLGDNRSYSYDSRRFGVLPKANIIGKVVLRAWPLDAVSAFGAPGYPAN